MGMQHKPPKLMDRVKAVMRVKRYSPRTEKNYCYWMRYFIRYHGIRHPATMGPAEVQAFLEHLAVERYVAAATQNQALNALVFLYRHVLDKPLGDIGTFSRAKRPRRLPIVLLNQLSGSMHLMATLMYGSGLRLIETCRVRWTVSIQTRAFPWAGNGCFLQAAFAVIMPLYKSGANGLLIALA